MYCSCSEEFTSQMFELNAKIRLAFYIKVLASCRLYFVETLSGYLPRCCFYKVHRAYGYLTTCKL